MLLLDCWTTGLVLLPNSAQVSLECVQLQHCSACALCPGICCTSTTWRRSADGGTSQRMSHFTWCHFFACHQSRSTTSVIQTFWDLVWPTMPVGRYACGAYVSSSEWCVRPDLACSEARICYMFPGNSNFCGNMKHGIVLVFLRYTALSLSRQLLMTECVRTSKQCCKVLVMQIVWSISSSGGYSLLGPVTESAVLLP